jgi:hypothetical protein
MATATTPTITGRFGVVLATAVLLFPIFSGAAQLLVDKHRDDLNGKLEEKKLALNQSLETTKNTLATRIQEETNRLEVNKLFLDHYQHASATEQQRTIDILVTLYPQEFVGVAKIFHKEASTPQIRIEIQKAASAATTTGKVLTGTPSAVSAATADVGTVESQGFAALASGDVAHARMQFLKAYTIFPTYHNVDEISHLVLTDATVRAYVAASPAIRSEMLRSILKTVIRNYSWGVPPPLLAQMQAKVR